MLQLHSFLALHAWLSLLLFFLCCYIQRYASNLNAFVMIGWSMFFGALLITPFAFLMLPIVFQNWNNTLIIMVRHHFNWGCILGLCEIDRKNRGCAYFYRHLFNTSLWYFMGQYLFRWANHTNYFNRIYFNPLRNLLFKLLS